MDEFIRKSDVLIEALPYIQAFAGKAIVVKYGGRALANSQVVRGILQDLVFLSAVGLRPVLIHGGGPLISERMAAAGKAAKFVKGMRVTDRETIRIVNESLERVNREFVQQIRMLGGKVEGLVARDGVIVAMPHKHAETLGYVGSVASVHAERIRRVFDRSMIPVVSPIGKCARQLYNINADEAACHVAGGLKAEKLVLLTNVRGILRQAGDVSSLIPTLSITEAKLLVDRHVIQEGMIPKVQACVAALRRGVGKTHIIDAAIPHALLLEIFTKTGIGTEIIH